MCSSDFDEMMRVGLEQAKAGQSRPVEEVFAELRREQTDDEKIDGAAARILKKFLPAFKELAK